MSPPGGFKPPAADPGDHDAASRPTAEGGIVIIVMA
jgi:hypothetical protein